MTDVLLLLTCTDIVLSCNALYCTVLQHGIQAAADCTANTVSDSLEAVVEANILLSGLGVECGGLAVAHGLHNALTRLPETHSLMHGQKVSSGILSSEQSVCPQINQQQQKIQEVCFNKQQKQAALAKTDQRRAAWSHFC